MATFTFQGGYGNTSEIKIKEGDMFIGRDPVCEIFIDKTDVSRKHARVRTLDGKVRIEDLGSSNGTFVNSTPIKAECELKHMDVIQIGKCMFIFNDAEAPAGPEPEPDAGDDSPDGKTSSQFSFKSLSDVIRKLESNIGRVFKGKPDVLRNVIVCLMADGHLLIEDAPGVGKSILAQSLAKSILGIYKRIQFTPDMLPSDITGINIYDEEKRDFLFKPGPVFGNIILADEINRTTPRTQSSLLECMSESVITIDGNTHVLPKPFFVVATQNPCDYHGTYPLPEPQLDRFLMRISIGYPSMDAEKEILNSQLVRHPIHDISYVINAIDIVKCQAQVRGVHLSDAIKEYIVRIMDASRKHSALATACSPRAALALMRSAQSLAAYHEREYVIPRDIRELAVPVLAHRVSVKLRAQSQWENSAQVINEIISNVKLENEDKGL